MEERLQKILSRAGVSSRRQAEELVSQGRVLVNGVSVTRLGAKADPERDQIVVDGSTVRLPHGHVYLVLNKPRGVVSTRHDPSGRPTVMDMVPRVRGLFPVGRLDVTTEGLILLTNDGDFAEHVAHPRYEVPRVYHAKVRGIPDEQALEKLTRGVWVDGERLAADRVRRIGAGVNAWLEVVLHEGKYHEVRRLLRAVGHPVSKLKRVGLGPIMTRGLKPGAFRPLSPGELRTLKKTKPRRIAPADKALRGARGVKGGTPQIGGRKTAGVRKADTRKVGTRKVGTRKADTRKAGTRKAGTRKAGTRKAGARGSGTRVRGKGR